MKIHRKLLSLAAVAAVAAAGTAYAAIPGPDGVISTCHAKVSGVRYLRLIDVQAGEACKGSEKLLTWNQNGSAEATAYGHVSAGGQLDQSRSRNLGGATVTKPAGTRGRYCIDGLPFTPQNISVTLGNESSFDGAGPQIPTPITSFGAFLCPGGTDVAIGMADPADGQFKRDHAFFFVLR